MATVVANPMAAAAGAAGYPPFSGPPAGGAVAVALNPLSTSTLLLSTGVADSSSSSSSSSSSAGGPSVLPSFLLSPSSGTVADRLRRARQHVEALKERIAGLRQAKEDDIDWAAWGAPSVDGQFKFGIRRSLRGHFGKIYACDWAGDNVTALSAGQDGKMVVWNAFSENKRDVIRLRSSWVMACAVDREGGGGSEPGKLVASGGLDNVVAIYDTHHHHHDAPRPPHDSLVGHDGYISDIKFLSGAQHGKLLTASGDGTVGLWDLGHGGTTGEGGGHGGSSRGMLGKSASLRGLGGSGAGDHHHRGGPHSSKRISAFDDHSRDVMGLAVHPLDPNVFATGSCDATVRIWDIRAGHSVRCFSGHVSDVNAVDFFPSGNTIASGSDDSSARMFDLRSSGPVNILTEDSVLCGVTDLCFSRSGALLFCSYEEPLVIAWEVASKDG